MDKIPLKIRLVRVYVKNKLILEVLQEYFNGLPHIEYKYSGLRKDYAYFILPNKYFWHVLWNIRQHLNSIHWGMCRFALYTYSGVIAKQYIYEITPGSWDSDELPPNVIIDSNLVDKLNSISESYYE